MIITDQTFTTSEGVSIRMKDQLINLLENVPSNSGMDTAKRQIDLANRLKECNGTLDMTPEDVVLARSIINRVVHLPPTIQIGMYEALEPKEPE